MRIAVVSNTAWYLFNFRLNLMQALVAQGHDVLAVAPFDGYAQRIQDAGLPFASVAISGAGINPFAEAKSLCSLGRLLHQHQVDAVLSYTPKGNVYAALACLALKIPYVPNVSGLGRSFIRKSPITWVVLALYRLTLRRARKVFFQNLDDMDVFVKAGLVRHERAERLPGSGVDLSRFVAQPLSERPQDAPIFLLVARLLWDKGVGEYVEAARLVRARYPHACFQLLGFLDVANPSAISRAQVDAWIQEGVVVYKGQTDDVRDCLRQADCVVLPSYREGVPRTLLEAAATARPVIATDVPGCRDTVIDGQSGYLCRSADAVDLADKILRFVALDQMQRQAMGQRGRAHVAAHFDEQVVIQRYVDLVAELARP